MPGRITGWRASRRHGFCYFSCHIGIKTERRVPRFRLRAAGKRPASSARLTNSFLPPLRRRDGRVHEGPVQAGRGRALGTSRDRPRERNEARAFSPFVQTSQTRARRSPQPEAKRDETRDGSDEISRRFSRARPDEPSPRTSATHITDRSKSATCYPSGTRT